MRHALPALGGWAARRSTRGRCSPEHPAAPGPRPALAGRHWAELQAITGRQLNLAEDAFKLQHLLDANLLARRWAGAAATAGGLAARELLGQLAARAAARCPAVHASALPLLARRAPLPPAPLAPHPHPLNCPRPAREDVEDLCNAAVKEEAIEAKLKAVAEQWAQEIFTFAEHKGRGPVVLKVGWGARRGGRREGRRCRRRVAAWIGRRSASRPPPPPAPAAFVLIPALPPARSTPLPLPASPASPPTPRS